MRHPRTPDIFSPGTFPYISSILPIFFHGGAERRGSGAGRGARAMKLLINGGVDMKYRTLTYRVSVMYS